MLTRTLAAILIGGPVLAQANAVPGLDIRMFDLTDIGMNGRHGTFPNGETGFSIGHSWCNSGTVNLPWVSQSGGIMVDQYPRIAFLLVRESGGRLVQVSGRSYCKHSPTAFNFQSGPCAPCTASGGGFFFVGCSDTYGSGTNASQINLGPTEEIDPWLGRWNPAGSYFDRGDPPVTGAAAIDSVKSLTFTQVSAFDQVKNRMVVRDGEIVAGANYYAQVYAMVQGEPVSARGNNAFSRQVTITGSNGNWSASTGGGSSFGPVLTMWPGATVHEAGNGNDDGRFMVAVKVTGPVAGMWHYEYAIQNLDNNRGGASFRIPTAAGAVVQNAGFRDLDTDPLNDWTFAQSPTEISFLSAGNNALEWNTIFNCWFDCSIAPGAGSMTIDEARAGAGALSVSVQADAPSGLAYATKTSIGSSCGICQGTAYEYFAATSAFDLSGRAVQMTLNGNGSAYTVADSTTAFVPASGVNLNLALRGLATVTLPFNLPYPGGTTNQIHIASSGYVTPVPMTQVDLLPTASLLVNGPPRWAAGWTVLIPTSPAGNVWYDSNPSRATVTWSGVPFAGNSGGSTFQMTLQPNGTVEYVWSVIPSSLFPALVGWTPGGGNLDPGSRDFSTTLSTPLVLCGPAFNGLSLDTDRTPVLGTTMQWQVRGAQAGSAFGALFRSLHQATPAIDLSSIGMPGCFQYVQAPISTVFASPTSFVQIPEVIPNRVALVGLELVGQAAAYSPPLTLFGLVASNGILVSLGL